MSGWTDRGGEAGALRADWGDGSACPGVGLARGLGAGRLGDGFTEDGDPPYPVFPARRSTKGVEDLLEEDLQKWRECAVARVTHFDV